MKVVKINTSPYEANVYLVNGTILIDTGMESNEIINELEKHIVLNDLKLILLTHCHYDHSGGAGGIAGATGAKIAIHREDASLLEDQDGSASSLFGKKAPVFKPDILLTGGEKFGGLEIIHTPGHTPGGICIYDPVSKILFSGDTVFEDGSFGRTDLYGGSTSKLIESIKKLTLLYVNVMYPGHGEIVRSGVNEQIRLSLIMISHYSK